MLDPEIVAAIQPWKKIIDTRGQHSVGVTKVTLRKPCERRECNIGNFIADALLHYYITSLSGDPEEPWKDSIIAIVNQATVRNTLNAGRKLIKLN